MKRIMMVYISHYCSKVAVKYRINIMEIMGFCFIILTFVYEYQLCTQMF